MDASEGEFLKEAEKKRRRVYSDKNNGDIRSNGIKEAQKTLLSLSAYNDKILKAVFEVVKPEDFQDGVYRRLAENIYTDSIEGRKSEPADMVSRFETLEEQNTAALVGALQNPYVDAVGHPGNPHYPVHIEEVVDAAKRCDKLIEINSHSFSHRKGSDRICPQFIRLCKQKDVRITVSSDAHICYNVGDFEDAVRALEAESFPEELIVSRDLQAFREYLEERKRRICQ